MIETKFRNALVTAAAWDHDKARVDRSELTAFRASRRGFMIPGEKMRAWSAPCEKHSV